MTREEYDNFVQIWANNFPESYQRLLSIARQTDVDPMQTLDAWYDIVFKTITLTEGKEAIARLQHSGEYTVWKLQDTPAIFRSTVTEIRRGQAHEDRWEIPATSGRRYKCGTCRDSGIVLCWHPKSMAEARASVMHHLPPDNTRVMVECGVACDCETGQERKILRNRWGRERELPTYDPKHWVQVDPALSQDGNRQRLWEWASAYAP